MRGPIEQFISMQVSALLRLGVNPREAVRIGEGAARIIARHLGGSALQLRPHKARPQATIVAAALLRQRGLSYAAIARELGCSRTEAFRRARLGLAA